MCLTKKSRLCFARWETRSWRKSRLLKIAGRDCFFFFLQQDSLDLMRQGLESCTTKKIKRGKKWRRQNVRVLVLPKNWICIHMPVEWYAIESTHVLCNIVKTNGVGYSCHPGEEHSFKSCLPFQDFSRVSLVSDPYCLCLLYYVERIRWIPAKAGTIHRLLDCWSPNYDSCMNLM